jgi:hypothetical protein
MDVKKNFEPDHPELLTPSHSTSADNNGSDVCNALIQQQNYFSKQISNFIERARQNGCFAKMRVVGSGGFLKILREDMTEKAKCLIEKEFIDDTISFEKPMLEKYLK